MSSILRALQKLDEETSGTIDLPQPLPLPIDPRKTIGKQAAGPYFLTRFLYGMIGLAIAVGIVWTVISQMIPSGTSSQTMTSKAGDPLPSPQPVTPKNPEPGPSAPPRREAKSIRFDPDKTVSRIPPATPKTVAPEYRVPSETSLPPGPTAPPPSEDEKQTRTPPSGASKPLIVAGHTLAPETQSTPLQKPMPDAPPDPMDTIATAKKPEARKQVTVVSEPSAPKPPALAPPVDPSRFDDLPEASLATLGLKIQALVYSPDPSQRMAVINGSIVKTGGFVDQNEVRHIGEDFVVIRRDSKDWKLIFQVQ